MWKSNKGDMAYQDYVNKFAEHGLKLLTTKEEFNAIDKRPSAVWLRVIGNCKHETKCSWDAIQAKVRKGVEVNMMCAPCLKKATSDKNKTKYKESSENSGNELEFKAVTYIKEELEEFFEVFFTNDGCNANLVIKPIEEEEQEYKKVSVRVTLEKYGTEYKFKTRSVPKDCIVICLCWEDKKTWVMDGVDVYKDDDEVRESISVGSSSKSMWYKYEVKKEDLIETVFKRYSEGDVYTLDECVIPTSNAQQIEHQYRLIRQEKIPYLTYVVPPIRNSIVDFYVNGLKVQEKVAYVRKDRRNMYNCFLKTSNGRTSDKCYDKGDNDIYWVWKNETEEFFIFTEELLIEKGYIQVDGDLNNKVKMISISADNWTKDYMYNINDRDLKEKLKNIFSNTNVSLENLHI